MNEPTIQQTETITDIVLDSGVSISELIAQYDQVLNDAAKHRSKLTNKVNTAIEKMNLDPNGDPEVLEAQIRLLETGDKLVQSREKAFLSRIQMRVKHQETDAQSKALTAMTAQILKELNVNKVAPYIANTSEVIDVDHVTKIEDQLNRLEEVEYDPGELRTDHTDLT